MGQYWIPVNLTKKEFVDPHKLGTGLKLWEQLANSPGTGAALIILCAAMPEPRGGGDLDLGGEMSDDYKAVAHSVIGRWAGDRIAFVGDYAQETDLLPEDHADKIYNWCVGEDWNERGGYTDISDMVCQVIEHELHGRFEGTGWRDFVSNG